MLQSEWRDGTVVCALVKAVGGHIPDTGGSVNITETTSLGKLTMCNIITSQALSILTHVLILAHFHEIGVVHPFHQISFEKLSTTLEFLR